MNIGEKIKHYRKKLDLTQTELGNILGVQKNAVSKWECGRVDNIPSSKIKTMAELFKIPVSYLIDDNENIDNLPNDSYPYNPIMHRIPILGTISAGLPLYAEQNIEGYTYTDLNGNEEYFALKVKGDSMNAARINDKDIIIVRRQCTVENGEIAVIMIEDNDAVVKRFYQNGENVTLVPQSTNPQHQPQMYDLKKTKIKIIGKVVRNQIDF